MKHFNLKSLMLTLILMSVGVGVTWGQVPTNVEAVDLGLPSGTKWANMNVGATTPEGYGNYYAWGEITPKDSYSGSNYIGPGSSVDVLPPTMDAATMNWGEEWSMPSRDQINELISQCSSSWTTRNGINGRIFTGPNGNSIFLPAAGYDITNGVNSNAYYWSSSQTSSKSPVLYFSSSEVNISNDNFYYGQSIRPIKNTNTSINIVIQNNITYLLDNDSKTATLCVGTSSSGNVVIPSSITSGGVSYSVTSIGQRAFSGNSSLKSISIPSTITSIGTSAFLNCFNLREIWNYSSLSLSTGSSSYGYVAYYARSIHTTNVASVITSVGDFDFYFISGTNYLCRYNGTSTNVTLPTSYNGSTYRIDNYTFQNKSFIKQLTIPANVTAIGSNAFYNCTNLWEIWNYSSLSLSKGSDNYGYVAKYAKVIHTTNEPSAFASVGDFDFYTDGGVAHLSRYNGTESSITLPTSYNGNAYEIDASAFRNKSFIQYVTIPANVASIANNTFSGTNLQKVFCLGSTPATLGGSDAIPQGTVYVPAGSKSAYSSASNWSSRTIYEGCAADNFALGLVDNSYLMVDGYIGNAGDEVTLTIPSTAVTGGTTYNVTKINSSAFTNNTALTNVVMPNSIEAVGSSAFKGCSNLKSVTMSRNITTLSDYAFQNCTSLESISIPAATITIGSYAFDGCTSIRSITIPSFCTSVATTAFNGCTALQSFTVNSSNSNYSTLDGVLTNKSQTQIVAYPSAKGSTYTIPSSITSIGDYAFRGSELTSISIPATVSTIYNYAFSNCPELKKVVFEAKTSSISLRDYVFRNSPIETVEIYRNISNWNSGSYTPFYNNTALKYAVIGDNITSLYSSMFYGCTSLNSVTLNDNITSIGSSAFYGCKSLASIKLPATVTSIGDAFLSGCSGLQEINAKMATPQALQATAFTGVDKNACKLIVPAEYVATYADTPGWMSFNYILAEDDANLRKMNVALTDGGTVTIDSHIYNCEGNHSFYASATAAVKVVISPRAGYFVKSVKQNGTDVTSRMDADILMLPRASAETTLEIEFAEGTADDTDLSAYDNVVYIEGAEAKVGSSQTLSLKLNNTVGITGFQCDVYLPEGIEVAKDADDFYEVSLSTERTTATKTNYFDSAEQPDGSVRIMCSSTKSYTFSGNEGEVATITVNIADGMEDGDYPLILRNIVLSDASANTYEVKHVKTTLSLTSYLLGDANNDSNINVGDFTAIANAIMGNPPATFVEKAADVNEDSEINVGDLTGVANLILYGVVSPSAAAKAANGVSYQPSSVSVDDCHISAGTEFTVAVDITGSYSFSGYQFDMMLPVGISVKMNGDEPCAWLSTTRTNEEHTNFFASDMMSENTVRVLATSTNGYTFSGNEGNVAYVTLVADRNIAEGEYIVGIDNIVLSANGATYMPSATNFKVRVGNVTGVNGVIPEDGSNPVYDLSGKMVSKTSSSKNLKKGIYIVNGNIITK